MSVDDWMPMDTAPKDGRLLLMCEANGERFLGRYGDYQKWETSSGNVAFPYLWHSLPEPPAMMDDVRARDLLRELATAHGDTDAGRACTMGARAIDELIRQSSAISAPMVPLVGHGGISGASDGQKLA
jgi:hypothetical protein